ncbi:MAG: hypothetical protein HFI91_12350 [Lachnospiraceae bacterium]|jgi:hypothetical protein|nr:hypothetical protein [Lachnospiraceae bacterium]
MGFRMKITGGPEEIAFDERSITKVDFDSISPSDSNARATDFGLTVKVWGKMLYKLGGGGNDPTLGLTQWSQVPSERPDCYRNAEITVISAGQVVRRFTLPDAFVMEYSEEVDDESGVGTFYIHMKQKKDENAAARIEGGFGGE